MRSIRVHPCPPCAVAVPECVVRSVQSQIDSMAAGGPEDEPFSPSDFLDLPPTPRRHDGDGPALRLEDDEHVLPFITRVLMEEDQEEEEDMDDNPDHRALLEAAQQPFAEILSDAAGTTKSSSAPAVANAACAWPYDPVELSQLLLLSVPGRRTTHTHPDPGPGLGLGLGAVVAGQQPQHGSDDRAVTMDMLNQAFLKGMEEASKFLPSTTTTTNNSLKLAESANGDGRGRKNRHLNWEEWDSLEAETGRKCKLMVPGTDEESSEVVDEFVLNGYQSLLEKMMDMSITMEADEKKNTTKGKGKGKDEAVDLRTLLLHCAQAVATGDGDRGNATQLLCKIKQRSSPRGDATQRLACCFAQGLEARLAGTGSQVYKSSLISSRFRTSAVEFHKAYQLYLAVSCFQMMAFKFSNMTICKAILSGGNGKVHIVDYGGENYGFQWPTLLGHLATWEGGSPEVKITAIDLPQPGFRPATRVEQTGRRLTSFARRCGVPFKFHSIVAKWETVSADDLDIEPDEVLIVNGLFHFGKLMTDELGLGADDDIDSPSSRDTVLSNIRDMRPDVLILCVENSSHNAPFFLARFREALFYYSAMFDMMDATTAPRDDAERVVVEQEMFGPCILNAIACEGSDRVERPETYRQWQARCVRAGMRQLPLDEGVVRAVRRKVKDGYHRDFVVDVDQQWLLQGWKGRILSAMSTWVADR